MIGAQVVVNQSIEHESVIVCGQEFAELSQLGLVRADRVRAAVRFELKPAEIFSGGGLQIECHVEAVCMLPYS